MMTLLSMELMQCAKRSLKNCVSNKQLQETEKYNANPSPIFLKN